MSRVTISLDEATYRRLVQHATQRDVPVEDAVDDIVSEAVSRNELYEAFKATADRIRRRGIVSAGPLPTREQANGIDPF
jgi:hypothetical protein